MKFEPLDLELTGGELEFEPLELKFSRLWRCTKPEAGALELTCLQTRPGKSEGGPLPEPAAARRALSADLVRRASVFGVETRVLSREELVRLKKLAGRSKDLIDVQELERLSGKDLGHP